MVDSEWWVEGGRPFTIYPQPPTIYTDLLAIEYRTDNTT